MIESTKNIATRSICKASNRLALSDFQSWISACPSSLRASGVSVSRTVSGSVVLTSIMLIVSPVISRVCALGIGITTNALS